VTAPERRPRQRRLALGVLLVAGALAVAAFPVRSTWWGGWILAVAEAGIVGGLADWFAVTAIFRRPLGLPIPHTAIIPANWELMARRVGTMVGDRVLTKEYVTDEIARVPLADLAARAAERITREDLETATRTLARFVVDQLTPETTEEAVARLRELLATQPAAPVIAAGLETARTHGWDQRAVTAVANSLVQALDRPAFRESVGDVIDDLLARYRERMDLYPRLWLGLATFLGLVDRDRAVAALHAGLRELAADPDHPLRQRVAELADELPGRLRKEPALAARVEAATQELLATPMVAQLLGDAAASLRRWMADDVAQPRSEVVTWIAGQLERARRALVTDAALREEVDRWIKARLTEAVERYHGRVAAFIENGVRALGPEGAVRLIEEHAGDDLQYIRVNGTVVGGLAGGLIYAVHLLLRLL
jgi:uncharacterized membrane-anchored protein YjiN (DUF445 family)